MLTLACLGAVAHRSTAAANEGAVVVAYKAEHAGLMMRRRKRESKKGLENAGEVRSIVKENQK